ncbi:Aspartate/homoserine dehydrogenase NAD-binding [Trinorchestia longiramus]|nr:Aspartate/homoserine dehydrogenase NAD-binding [Trinorchestia longiramus]
MCAKRIGIVGYGHLGKYLVKAVEEHPLLELAFVWNRSPGSLVNVEKKLVCTDLRQVAGYAPDLIVEVAHPDVTREYGELFLSVAHYMIGSPTAMADPEVEARLRHAADAGKYGLYVPAGALWGGADIRKLVVLGTLESLKITMKKHPSSFKLGGVLKDKNDEITSGTGPVTLLTDRHIVVVEVGGKGGFKVTTERYNPAKLGAVTGNATYNSFLSSVVAAGTQGSGIHLC